MTSEHFVEDHADGPDVRFKWVLIFSKDLRRHVFRRANIIKILFSGFNLIDSKTKISYLYLIFRIEEQVSWLEISMNNMIFM